MDLADGNTEALKIIETAQHILDRQGPLHFDEWQDDHVAAVVPYDLRKPVQDLLITLSTIERTQGSFGVDQNKALEQIIPELQALRKACITRWEEI